MVKHAPALFAPLLVLCSALGGADRDRKARVALALAATPNGPVVAPPGYAETYRLAVERGQPLVLYVGCVGRHPVERIADTVVGATPELSGYEPGTVVVGYPHAGRLFVHAALRCPDHGEPVTKAVEEARKKIAAPPGKPDAVPVPLNWDV